MNSFFYPSIMNINTLSGCPFGAMNLFWNAQCADVAARSYFNWVPNFGDSFRGCGGFFDSNAYLLDPNYAMKQIQWRNGGFQFNCFGNNNWLNPGGNTTTPSDDTSELKDEQQKQNYEKFKKVLNTIKNDPTAATIKSDIEKAIADAGKLKTYDEKMAKLNEVYARVDQKAKVNYFTGGDIYKSDLAGMGYDDCNTGLDKAVNQLNDYFKPENKETRKTTPFALGSYVASGITQDNILGFVSRWNSITKKDLIKTLQDGYDTDKKNAENPGKLDELMSNLKQALINKARAVCNTLPTGSDTELKTKINDLEGKDTKYSEEFKALYEELRKQEKEALSRKYDAEYGFITDTSAKDAIIANIDADIEEETKISSSGVGDSNNGSDDNATDVEILNSYVNLEGVDDKCKEAITEANKLLAEIKANNPQDSDIKSGENKNGKYKAVYSGDKWINVFYDNNNNVTKITISYDTTKVKKADGTEADLAEVEYDIKNKKVKVNYDHSNGNYEEMNIKISDKDGLTSYAKDIVGLQKSSEEQEKAEENAKTAETNSKLDKAYKDGMSKDPKGCGVNAANYLIGYTNDADGAAVIKYIENINKDNVIEFLKGYYSNRDGSYSGFFEQIHHEGGKVGEKFTNGMMAKILYAIIEHCDEVGKSGSVEYQTIVDSYNKLNKNPNESYQETNVLYRYCGIFDWTGDDDNLDDAIEELFDDFKDTETTTTTTTTTTGS